MTICRWLRANKVKMVKEKNLQVRGHVASAMYTIHDRCIHYNPEMIREDAEILGAPLRWYFLNLIVHEAMHAQQHLEGRLTNRWRWQVEAEAFAEADRYMLKYRPLPTEVAIRHREIVRKMIHLYREMDLRDVEKVLLGGL